MRASYTNGHKAELIAADYLRNLRFTVLDMNWKTRWCEIDIVAERDKTVYFVEVKYRRSDDHGTGFDYITNTKLQQMTLAAEWWAQEHSRFDEYHLAAIEVYGPDFVVTQFLPDLL